MATAEVKRRKTGLPSPLPKDFGGGARERVLAADEHPAGEIKHGGVAQFLRMVSLASWFWTCCCVIHATQIIGVPLYWINKDLYYAYMALTKQSFGLLIATMTQWWSPTVVRISGDASVVGQIRRTADGRVECSFPERLVLIANHQLYTDWVYLWWAAYTNRPSTHGHIYIIAKESLKNVPIIGWGMSFYGFIFMSRKMATDQPRLEHRLGQLKKKHAGPMSGSEGLDPMWLLLFPEGTNASDNGRANSAKWAAKVGIKDVEHTLLPRSTGSFFCLNQLKGTVEYVYDCTMAYEGVPRGKFGQDYFTLTSSYFQGRPPKSVNLYWRRFAVSSIPLDDAQEFETWMRDRWYEKDALMEQYMTTGRFPATEAEENERLGMKGGFVETEVKPEHWWEVCNIFVVLATVVLLGGLVGRWWGVLAGRNQEDSRH